MVGFWANGLRLTSNMVYEATYPVSEATKSMRNMHGAGGWMMKMRKVLGKLLSVIPHRLWVNWFDALVANEKDDGLLAIPTGRKLYGGEIFPADVYLPPRTAIFEGIRWKSISLIFMGRTIWSYLLLRSENAILSWNLI